MILARDGLATAHWPYKIGFRRAHNIRESLTILKVLATILSQHRRIQPIYRGDA